MVPSSAARATNPVTVCDTSPVDSPQRCPSGAPDKQRPGSGAGTWDHHFQPIVRHQDLEHARTRRSTSAPVFRFGGGTRHGLGRVRRGDVRRRARRRTRSGGEAASAANVGTICRIIAVRRIASVRAEARRLEMGEHRRGRDRAAPGPDRDREHRAIAGAWRIRSSSTKRWCCDTNRSGAASSTWSPPSSCGASSTTPPRSGKEPECQQIVGNVDADEVREGEVPGRNSHRVRRSIFCAEDRGRSGPEGPKWLAVQSLASLSRTMGA